MGIIQVLLALLVLGYFLSGAVMVFFLWPSFTRQRKSHKQEKEIKLQRKIYKTIRRELDQREQMTPDEGDRLRRVPRGRRFFDEPRGELRPDFDAMIARARAKIEQAERDIETLQRDKALGEPKGEPEL